MTDLFSSATDSPKVDESEVKRDRYGRYMLPPLKNSDSKAVPYTRATTFCKSVSDTFGLMQWSNRMVAKGVAMRPDLYALASATDVTDRKTFDKLADDAKEAAGASTAASLGTALHSFTELVDRGEDPEVPLQWKGDIDAYKALKAKSGLEIPMWAIERIVIIEKYGVAGTFDRIAKITTELEVGKHTLHPGDWVVLDVKTGKDLKYAFGDISIQLALYANADAIWNGSEGEFEEMPEGLRQDVALVVHLPAGKKKADLYAVDIESGWKAAELCASVRTWRKTRDLAAKADFGDKTWEDQIDDAKTRADLSAVWKKASEAGEWTKQLERRGKARLHEIS